MINISAKAIEFVQSNLDSMRIKLLNIADEAYFDTTSEKYDRAMERVDEIENLLHKINTGHISKAEWERARSIANERDAIRAIYQR